MTAARRPAPGDTRPTHARRRPARDRPAATPTPAARTQAILEERARLLARRPAPARAAGHTLDVLMFGLGAERYGIEIRFVREVTRLVDVTPVPGTPAFVAGLAAHRGAMLCLIELRHLLSAPVTPLPDVSRLIVLGEEEPEFALLAGHADEIQPLDRGDVLPPPAGSDHLLGVTASGLVVLDGASLLRSPWLYVDQRGTEAP